MSASKPAPGVSGPTLLAPANTYLRPELADLKVIGVEEHLLLPEVVAKLPNDGRAGRSRNMYLDFHGYPGFGYIRGRGLDVIGQRIKDMDQGGIAKQILSFSFPPANTTFMEPDAGAQVAREINDSLKSAVDQKPDRFYAVAELPFQAPELAIAELRRCVKDMGFKGAMLSGTVGGNGQFLDDPKFDQLLSAFEELDVPLYLHPGVPPHEIIDMYYTIPENPRATALFSCAGWGWHNEAAIHAIRLAVSGTLDRHPKLKVVLGHAGSMIPQMMHRLDNLLDKEGIGIQRSVGEILRSQVWLSISGIFDLPPVMAAIQTWGVDHVLFGNDYPFVDAQRVPDFLCGLGNLVAPSDMRKICQTNAEKLFKLDVQ